MISWLSGFTAPHQDAADPPVVEEYEEAAQELARRDARCYMAKGNAWWYTRAGNPIELAARPFDEADCVHLPNQRRRILLPERRARGTVFDVPSADAFTPQTPSAPTVPDHIAVVSAPANPIVAAARTKQLRHYTRDPGAVDDDPSAYALPTALVDYDPALTQDLLYQYFHGRADGTASGRYDRRVDWRALLEPVDAAGRPTMPPGTCDAADRRMKPHQVPTYTYLRMWAARQGSGGAVDVAAVARVGVGGGRVRARVPDGEPLVASDRFAPRPYDPTRTPKGFLVFHSLGSGKTNVTVAGLDAFWNQRLLDGSSRPLYVLTSKENKGQMAKKGDGSSRYYAAAKDMLPSSVGSLSSADFHAGYELLSFNQAGLRLGYPMSDLAEGAPPVRRLATAKPDFVARMRNAVIFLDEVQGIFTPLPAFRNTNGGLREWLGSEEADGATIVLLTATPGKSVAELFALVNVLKRRDDKLDPSAYARQDAATGEWVVDADGFRAAVAGQVSFVDLSNNTHDFPRVAVEVVRAPMSPAHFAAWRDKALADAKEEADGGPRAWARLVNKGEYAQTSRKWSNMTFPASRLEGGPPAREVYRRGALDEVAAYSAKLAALARNVVERERGGKQYVYSAFGEQGIHQVADVLEAHGWTNLSGKVRPLFEVVTALRNAERAGTDPDAVRRLTDRLEAEIARLPGQPFKRFLTTREWSDETTGGSGGSGSGGSRGPRPNYHRPQQQKRPQQEREQREQRDEDDQGHVGRTTDQLMELDVFNAVRNTHGEVAAVLLASKKFNEGIDNKAIRFLHIFEPLVSVPAEQQTVGRGRRYCSHAALPEEERDMIVFHYFSVEPEGQSVLVDQVLGLEEAAREADRAVQEGSAKVQRLQLRLQQLAAQAGQARHVDAPAAAPTAATALVASATSAAAPGTDGAKGVEAEPKRRAPSGGRRRKLKGGEVVDGEVAADGNDTVEAVRHLTDRVMQDLVLRGGRSAGAAVSDVVVQLPWMVTKRAAEGAVQGAREWWHMRRDYGDGNGDEPTSAEFRATDLGEARDADAHVAEVRRTLLVHEQALDATTRKITELRARGIQPDWTVLVQADLQRDRVRLLREREAALRAVDKQVEADFRAVRKLAARPRQPADVQATLARIQEEMDAVKQELVAEAGKVADARAAADAARKQAVEKRARVLPEWRHLLQQVEGDGGIPAVVGSGRDGRVLKRDLEAAAKAAQPIMLTDVLIHGISRREYEPMRVLLQALRDAAVDCRVLHGLHARMGIATNCRV